MRCCCGARVELALQAGSGLGVLDSELGFASADLQQTDGVPSGLGCAVEPGKKGRGNLRAHGEASEAAESGGNGWRLRSGHPELGETARLGVLNEPEQAVQRRGGRRFDPDDGRVGEVVSENGHGGASSDEWVRGLGARHRARGELGAGPGHEHPATQHAFTRGEGIR